MNNNCSNLDDSSLIFTSYFSNINFNIFPSSNSKHFEISFLFAFHSKLSPQPWLHNASEPGRLNIPKYVLYFYVLYKYINWEMSGEGFRNLNPLRPIFFPFVYAISYIRMKWLGHVAHASNKRNICIVLVGKHQGKSSLGWPRLTGGIILKWVWKYVGWIILARDTHKWRSLVNSVINIPDSIKDFFT
jgi:hypothetical protein